MKSTRALIAAFVIAIFAQGCLPTNNFSSSRSTSTTNLGSGLSSNASNDGAQAPCTMYDTSSPTRTICRSCYNSILATSCPGKSTFSSCADTTVRNNYISLINQCISQSIVAGFTCNKTCSGSQVLNSATCTCGPPATTTGSGSIVFVDTGQKDVGPPLVGAAFPKSALQGTPGTSSCTGTLPLYLSVMNRGDTVFRLNQYGTPVITTSNNLETPTAGKYVPSATKPVALTADEMTVVPGANVLASVNFRTGGEAEVTSATGNLTSVISTVSGADSSGTSYSGDSIAGTDATWASGGFGARDSSGNVYFSDPLGHVVSVICYQISAGHPYCDSASVTAGNIRIVAGIPGQPGYSGENSSARSAKLNSPHGIAVDSLNNVYIADSGNHAIRMVCGTSTSGPCAAGGMTIAAAAGTVGRIYAVAGELFNSSIVESGNDTTHLNFPYGLDVSVSGSKANIYIADYQNHRIRVFCGFVGSGCAAASGNIQNILGSGTAGYRADGATTTVNAWARNPSDVKINWNGNLIYTDSRNHLLRAICYDGTYNDFCAGSAGTSGAPRVQTLAGKIGSSNTPQPGNTGSGVASTESLITYPTQIQIAKRYSSDLSNPGPAFRDNNILFTERLRAPGLMAGQPDPTRLHSMSVSTSAKRLAMGLNHTCANGGSGGGVRCFGESASGLVSGLSTTSLATVAGTYHTCAISQTSLTISCWGDNSAGQLGDGTYIDQTSAKLVQPPTNTTAAGIDSYSTLAAGDSHTCAIASSTDYENRVACWGDNSFGQLGNTSYTSHQNPRPTTAFGSGAADSWSYTQLTSGANHNCAVALDGTTGNLYCWGANNSGQLSDSISSSLQTLSYPIRIRTYDNSTRSLKIASGGDHNCWVDDLAVGGVSPGVQCWGSNDYGESGPNADPTSPGTETLVPLGSETPIQIALGIYHSCTLTASNTVYCWGSNQYGQLGNDEVAQSASPLEVVGLPSGTIQRLYAGGNQTCVVYSTNAAYCWGDNRKLQLGSLASSTSSSGNVVRIICGNNDTTTAANITNGITSTGLCKGISEANTIYTFSGSPGKAGNRSTGDTGSGRSALFAKLVGMTYDKYKNLIVSSSGFLDKAGTEYLDFNLRRILSAVSGPVSGVKYSFTDSSALSSYYCLRFKPVAACDSDGTCACSVMQPTDESNPDFWSAITQNSTCGTN